MNTKEPFCFWNLISIYWWKVLLIKITGGRPMIYLGFNFRDVVSGESVNDYQDKLGRYWLATSRWAIFRVRKNT